MAINADPDRGYTPTEKVRIFEASCQIDFPAPEEQNFRIAMMKMFAHEMSFPELKSFKITGPGTGVQRPALTTSAKR